MKKIFSSKNKNKQGGAEVSAESLAVGLDRVVFEKVHPDAVIPTYADEGDSGMDVYAIEDMIVRPGFNGIVKIGLKMEIPVHPLHALGYRNECQARPRSGMSGKTYIRVSNAPGTIDNFYVDEVGIILHNTAEITGLMLDYALDLKGNKVPIEGIVPANSYIIHKGDRIAQLVFNEIVRPRKIVEGVVSNKNNRGGGFGHSGK